MYIPKISVVIPAYNAEKWLDETLQSVVNQTFEDWEAVVVDDGSTDKTVEIVNKWSFKDSRIKSFAHTRNLGCASACNTAISNSKGDYIALLGADDTWEPSKLSRQYNKIAVRDDIAVSITHANCFGSEDKSKEQVFNQPNRNRLEILRHFFYFGNFICDSSALVRRSVFNDVGLYNPRFQALSDWDFWVRVAMKYNINMIEERLTNIRIRPDSSSFNRVDTVVQCNYETPHIMNHFLKMSLDTFYKMVPDAEKNYGMQFNEELIPCMLATEAIFHGNFAPHLQWGLDTLYLELGRIPEVINKTFNYTYPDFHRMSRKIDVYRTQASIDYIQLKEKLKLNGINI